MSYALGIDLGTTFSAAAVARNGQAEILSLGYRSPTLPSVIVARESGEILIGEAAERRSLIEPLRTAREFKRRLGDPTPILLGSAPYGAETLMSYLLRGIYDLVVEQEGGPPATLVISHPANWGLYKLDLLEQAVRMADVGDAQYITEPVAAALHYAGRERIEPGEVVAVYDFGGGTFDAALLRRTETSFEPLGNPEGIERLGGIDFDEAVFAHVMQSISDLVGDLDPSDSTAMSAVARLRDESRQAKEVLSIDTDVTIPVMLPGVQTEVRLTRSEFEEMVEPRIGATIAALRRAARSAEVDLNDVDRILLVGGSSRIPLVRQRVREETDSEIFLDAHPKYAIALGAAIAADLNLGTSIAAQMSALAAPAAAQAVVEPPPVAPEPPPVVEEPPPAVPEPAPVIEEPPAPPEPPPVPVAPPPAPPAPEPPPAESAALEPEEPPAESALERALGAATVAAAASAASPPEVVDVLEPPPVEEPTAEREVEVAPEPVETWEVDEELTGTDELPDLEPPPPPPPDVVEAAPETGEVAAESLPVGDVASSQWQDGIALSPALIGGLVATMILSAAVVFTLLTVLVG